MLWITSEKRPAITAHTVQTAANAAVVVMVENKSASAVTSTRPR